MEGDIGYYETEGTEDEKKKLEELKKKKEEKDEEMTEEQRIRKFTNAGYCFVVLKSCTDAVPLQDNRVF